jgi:hypothetical protein
MRVGILSIVVSSLLATASVGLARQQPEEAPPPPEPSEPLPSEAPMRSGTVEHAPMTSSPTPAWQAPPGGYGGYGGWYGVWGDGCSGGCCHSCCSCCCRPSLIDRIKALKCKLCTAIVCRRACRSCCSSSCSSCSSSSSCCGSEYLGHEAPLAPTPSNVLPTPPVDSAPYDRADGEDMSDDDASYRPMTAATPVVRRQYSMPQAKPARKPAKTKARSRG